MARLIDVMIADVMKHGMKIFGQSCVKSINTLRAMPVFDIRDIQRMYYEETSGGNFFPYRRECITCPYETAWFEYNIGNAKLGCMVTMGDNDEWLDHITESISPAYDDLAYDWDADYAAEFMMKHRSIARWGMKMVFWAGSRRRNVPIFTKYMLLDGRGKVLTNSSFGDLPDDHSAVEGTNFNEDGPYFCYTHRDVDDTNLWMLQVMEQRHVQELFGPVFMALSLLNCKTISHEEREPPPKLSKKHAKKTGNPLRSYHVLRLDLLSMSKGSAEGTGEGGKKRLHMCRGHFAKYTQEKPMLGKYVGTYWRPSHVRGQKKLGYADKDYALVAGGN